MSASHQITQSQPDSFEFHKESIPGSTRVRFIMGVAKLCYDIPSDRKRIDKRLGEIREAFAQGARDSGYEIGFTRTRYDELAKDLADRLCTAKAADGDLDQRLTDIVKSGVFDLMAKSVKPSEFQEVNRAFHVPRYIRCAKDYGALDSGVTVAPTLHDWFTTSWGAFTIAGKKKIGSDELNIKFLKASDGLTFGVGLNYDLAKLIAYQDYKPGEDRKAAEKEFVDSELNVHLDKSDIGYEINFGGQTHDLYRLKKALLSKDPEALKKAAPVFQDLVDTFDQGDRATVKRLLLQHLEELKNREKQSFSGACAIQ